MIPPGIPIVRGRHHGGRKAPRWARHLALALLLGNGPVAHAQQAVGPVQQVGDAIVFEGQINRDTAAHFLRLLRDPAITRLVINSRGGLVGPALDMAHAIHERQLDVEVPSACHSSCANYIFPAARRKLLGRPGVVGWHGNMAHVLWLQQSGPRRWNEQQMVAARKLARREREFFRRIGVDGFVCWFAKIPPYGVEDLYTLAVEDMAGFGIVGVTQRDGAAPAPPGTQLVRVDWAGLERLRPAVALDP